MSEKETIERLVFCIGLFELVLGIKTFNFKLIYEFSYFENLICKLILHWVFQFFILEYHNSKIA